MGHNLLSIAKKNPNIMHVGVDPFINGIANLVNNCLKYKIVNILIYPKPIEVFLKKFKNILWNKVFILFPDPWPKKKHNKRRLFQLVFILKLLKNIKKGGKIFFATDNKNYYEQVNSELKNLIANKLPISLIKKDPKYLVKTKYFKRSQKLGNIVHFLVIVKN